MPERSNWQGPGAADTELLRVLGGVQFEQHQPASGKDAVKLERYETSNASQVTLVTERYCGLLTAGGPSQRSISGSHSAITELMRGVREVGGAD